MSKNKIKVGMNVYTIPVGFNNTRPIKDDIEKHIKEEKVSKVGRKYFYLEGGDEKYNLDNLKYDSDYHYDMQAFLSKQEILDDIEKDKLLKQIKHKISVSNKENFTLDQLRRINEIITI